MSADESPFDSLVGRKEAVERVLDVRTRVLAGRSVEVIGLEDVAGRVVAESIVADRDLPSVSSATMDGFAFDANEEFPLQIREEAVFPEDDPPPLKSGEAVRVATGAPLPEGANAVVKREDARVQDAQLESEPIAPGTYTYERGSNVRAGEAMFEVGEVLSPKDAVLLGDLGVESLSVATRFRVAVVATGTEIHQGRSKDLDSAMLVGLLRSWGHEAVYEGTVPDQYDRVRNRIAGLADTYDVVVTTGGTSVGKKDYVLRALEELGSVAFHGVQIRPGKPIGFAELRDQGAVAFAIPGKPVGAHTITTLVARPFFTGDSSLPGVELRLARDVGIGRSGFEYVVPVTVDEDVGEAFPLGHADSVLMVYRETFNPSVLSQSTRATRADGFVILTDDAEAGDRVRVVPYAVVE